MNTEQKRALLHCPFCGGEAHFDSDDDGWNWIECGSCRVATNHRTSAMDDCRPLLAEAWNRRAALQSQDREDAERYRWLLEQAWFQEAFDRFDPDDGGSLPRFVSECARIIDRARRVEGEKP
ncbi:Lar family restriction alleviation protein [Alcaligenaceae bacterium]|nr:Lar family restriction alleviation protein [Alcaligenaceae bacterium]